MVNVIAFHMQLKLRWYGSKSVVKYPRCSIRRHSTYADAEVILYLFICRFCLVFMFCSMLYLCPKSAVNVIKKKTHLCYVTP